MQTLESLGVPASAFLIPHTQQHTMPEAPSAVQTGWGHPSQQGFPMDQPQQQQQGMNASNHIFVMNNAKPEQSTQRREEVVISSPPTPNASSNPPSVITATYNPTYNRCLPKILSDLDCEMKIKQVLRCIENILLENGDVDLQQQAYKLPDRSSSPQFAKSTTKKAKFKEDEEMVMSPNPSINLPLATNSPASLINKATANKNSIKVNVKVEPEPSAQYQQQQQQQQMSNGSPRSAQMFDFSYKQAQAQAHAQAQAQAQAHAHAQAQAQYAQQMGQPPRQFGYEMPPSHPSQPMIPHMQLSMSSPHMSGPVHSPHLQQHHLHASSPHLHNSHTNSPHMQHSPLSHVNSPHLVHSPVPHSPQVASPQLPATSPLTQFQVLTNPHPSEQSHHADSSMSDFQNHYPVSFDGVQVEKN